MPVAPPGGPTPQTGFQGSFAAGELAPALHYRADLAKWHTGAAVMRNFFVQVQGGATTRPGTEFIGRTKAVNDPNTRLIPFTFNPQQTYVLEFGNEYLRFISLGAYLMNPDGSYYEVPTPYQSADLPVLRYAQSGDVLKLTHASYPPLELQRLGQLSWQLIQTVFAAVIQPPTGVAVQAIPGSAASANTTPALVQIGYRYAICSVSITNSDTSNLSAEADCSNYDLGYFQQYGVLNTVTWNAVPGADYYNVYRYYNGAWGFIASTQALVLQDQNILPDTSNTPPQHQNPFVGNNPGVVGFYQQRSVYAGSNSNPQTMWFSRSGNYRSFDTSQPGQDDDAITLTIAAQQVNQIEHFVPLSDLIVMTGAGAFRITSTSNGTLTPSSTQVLPQTYAGSADIQPIVINYDVLYVQARGSVVRDLTYNYYANVYTGNDISVMAFHLFYGYTILQWAYAEEPYKLVWAIRSDGTLLCLTYLKEQDIYAWSHHDTQGSFLGVTVVTEYVNGVGEDRAYFLVQRTIGGEQVTYVERMASRLLGPGNNDASQGWFVDCGLRYSGAPETTFSGLDYIDGELVSILADGSVMPQQTVVGGSVILPVAASLVTIGLPITAQLLTLPLDQAQAPSSGRRKRISKVRLAVENTRGLKVGTFGAGLVEIKERTTEPYGSPPALQTGMEFAWNTPKWDIPGQVLIQQDNPLPATVLGVMLEFEEGF